MFCTRRGQLLYRGGETFRESIKGSEIRARFTEVVMSSTSQRTHGLLVAEPQTRAGQLWWLAGLGSVLAAGVTAYYRG